MTSRTPVYVATGFLDAGKTRLLNGVLRRRLAEGVRPLVLQFESGEDALLPLPSSGAMEFPKRELERDPEEIARRIAERLGKGDIDEVWVEWNGVVPLGALQSMLSDPPLRALCRIAGVVHAVDADALERLLGRTGEAMPEQLANCDVVAARGGRETIAAATRIARGFNPGVPVFDSEAVGEILARVRRAGLSHALRAYALFFGSLALAAGGAFFFDLSQPPFKRLLVVFLGILLQAVPFLILGTLLSSAIQLFVSGELIRRIFPRRFGPGTLAALLAGFCLPVCDCASIPVFRGLLRKGVPVSTAAIFLTASPIINPVALLSTYYAFNGDSRVVFARAALGIVAAVMIGLFFELFPSGSEALLKRFDLATCDCGSPQPVGPSPKAVDGLFLFAGHARAEFFGVAKYLVFGALFSACIHTFGAGLFSAHPGRGLAGPVLVMMATAFLLSLCSSSDAAVAAGFALKIPPAATMAFLIFGPMMDVKNVLMLSAGFSKAFIAKLATTVFAVCFCTAMLYGVTGVGGAALAAAVLLTLRYVY